ncbi:myelin protein zero-like protein 2 isoform X1 [Myotis daubentonii]|uniref:myelin protein zero-like protein 2 isoform X1 n=1 Tax=Myotis daubentonii TaxID=98922 RepID=UPI002873AE73|nr:myelin protein zero-like protein 2 isoform X1 [Myotis daubentonii]XP_059563678.1 myelin protein zero-like protein 2 isoform X1 [Myotis daubentonii]
MYGRSLPRAALLLLGIQLTALGPGAAVEIYTSRVLEAVNGTDVRLKCTFSSFAPVGDALTVTWNFRPQDGGSEQFVFYYHMEPFKPMSGRFKDRVVWDGNPERSDASIMLWKLRFDDNGTYTCQVKNPPDVDGLVGEIRLSVVQTEKKKKDSTKRRRSRFTWKTQTNVPQRRRRRPRPQEEPKWGEACRWPFRGDLFPTSSAHDHPDQHPEPSRGDTAKAPLAEDLFSVSYSASNFK